MRHHNHESSVRHRARTASSALLCLCAALALSAPSALAQRGHVFGKTFGASGSGAGQLKEPAGIAVSEATHQLYVVDRGNNRVEWFNAAGEFEGQFDGSGSFEVKGKVETGEAAPAGKLLYNPGESPTIAVDNTCAQNRLSEATKPKCKEFDPSNGDVYVQDGFEHKVVDKFSPSGAYLGELVVPAEGPALEIAGVAVDFQGHPWIAEDQGLRIGFAKFADGEDEEVEFEGVVTPTSGGFLLEPGLALDMHGDLFADTTFGATKLSPKGVVLQEAIDQEAEENGEGASGVASELPADTVYVDNETSIRRFGDEDPAGEIEQIGEGHLVKGSGVAVDALKETVWVADQGASKIVEFAPEPAKAPTVAAESSSAVTASSASLRAEVNPRGAATEYRFEYGRCATAESCSESGYEASTPVPDGPVGADFEYHEVAAHTQGLEPATTYHFRVLAHNTLGETPGEELIFTTQPAGVLGLLDGRGYELVSPPEKHGAKLLSIEEATVIEAALSGDAITYPTNVPTEAEPAGYTNGAQVISSRGASGWSSKDITIAHPIATGAPTGEGNEYRYSSADLSAGIVQPFGAFEPGLSKEASEQTPYLHSNYLGTDPSAFCETDCLTPLVTAKNVAEGVAFGEEGLCPSFPAHVLCGPQFLSATEDLSHIVIHSNVGLSEWPGDHGGLYEWSGGTLQLVSVLPGGEAAAPAVLQELGFNNSVMRGAISPDGDRVVWSRNAGHLYLREVAAQRTIELDAGLSGEARYQAADAQTKRIFFSDGGGLYLYDTETAQRTTLVKAGGGVLGYAVGASEDGTYLYFVANEALAGAAGAVEGDCSEGGLAAAHSCNLYELREAEGQWQARVVAVISEEDFPDFAGNGAGGLRQLTARVSPDGRHLAFMSQRPLTGYDNRDAVSGRRDEEVFLFDAQSGRLVCASCQATGARPEGVEYQKLEGGPVAGGGVWHLTSRLAASVPGWTPYAGGRALHQSRYLSNSGRLYFNSADGLSPQDVNGTEDVYEYEPPGIGSCTTTDPSFNARAGGCVGLISSGSSREESGFIDASQSGSDVFFQTTAKLVGQDLDTALDIYDAHECTSASPCIKSAEPPSPPCASEASCKAPPTPQPEIFGAPASATFSGAGNITSPPPAATPKPGVVKPKTLTRAQKLAAALKTCRKQHDRHRRLVCEKRVRGKYGKRPV
jgi:hypothetical protein